MGEWQESAIKRRELRHGCVDDSWAHSKRHHGKPYKLDVLYCWPDWMFERSRISKGCWTLFPCRLFIDRDICWHTDGRYEKLRDALKGAQAIDCDAYRAEHIIAWRIVCQNNKKSDYDIHGGLVE